MNILVSIIIIGRNEARTVGKCIKVAQREAERIGGAEIIFIDSHSIDRTAELAKRCGIEVIGLDPRLRLSPAAARHFGSKHARGEFILFLDADTRLYDDFLPGALRYLQRNPTVGGVNGQIDDLNEFGERVTGIEGRHETIVDTKWLRGPCCFYRAEALRSVGSFDPELATEEEAELGLRLIRKGWSLKILPLAMACHTRCYHGDSIGTIISTFKRDVRSRRLGEITKTIAQAFRAGNGFAFCWLRLQTTVSFLAWLLAIAACLLLPGRSYPAAVMFSLILLGGIGIYAKKRSIYQSLIFVPSKIANVIDILAGITKIGRTDRTSPLLQE